MKNSSREIDFGIMENAEPERLDPLYKRVPQASSADMERILEMSRRKYEIMKSDVSPADTVSGSEPYRPHTLRRIAAAAACTLIAGGIAGGAVLLNIHGNLPSAETEETTAETTTEETTMPQEETSQSKEKSHAELIDDCVNEFFETDGKNATDVYCAEYDVNGDGINEVFFRYHSPDPVFKEDVCELYAYNGEKYDRLSVKSENIWVHPDSRDGVIIIKANSEPIIYLVFQLNADNELELLRQFRGTSEDGVITYTIDGELCTENEWERALEETVPKETVWEEYAEKIT